MQTEMSSSPTGGSLRQAQDRLRLPAGKHTGILTEFQTKVNKKIKIIHRGEHRGRRV